MASPFNIGGNAQGNAQGMGAGNFGTSAQHGTAEQGRGQFFTGNVGGGLGMTPPQSPRRSTSPRVGPRNNSTPRRDRAREESEDANRDRERDRRRRPPRDFEEEQPLPEGWGARMLAAENKIKELQTVVEQVNTKATEKIDQMKTFVNEVEARFTQLERAVPERFHANESRQESFVLTLNALSTSIHDKFKQFEESLSNRSVPPVPPSFGGPTPTEAYHIGSPLSAPPDKKDNFDPWSNFAQSRSAYASGGTPQDSVPPANAPQQRGAGAHKPWEPREWSASEIKVAKELKPFVGTHGAYKIWANRVKDHFRKKNIDWSHIFAEIEAQKTQIPRSTLKMGYLNGNGYAFDVDFAWVSNALWTFIGEHVVDSVYNNRSVLAGGGENGLELWRALFVKHEGGADQVELGGIGSLHSFPQCDKVESLQHWIGKWQEMKDTYGTGISDVHLKSMFINILPPSVQKEVREKPGLATLQQCIDHVLADLGRLNDVHLSKLHTERLKQSLHPTQRISPVLEKDEQQVKEEVTTDGSDFKSLINILTSKMDTFVAAVGATRTTAKPQTGARTSTGARVPSDFQKFGNRCLHCGSEDHRAINCPVKKSLMAKNNGKLPPGYKSAFDKWKAKQAKSVHAVLEEATSEIGSEFSETDDVPLWCLPQCAVQVKQVCPPCTVTHENSFAALFDNDDDDDDDESKVLDALKHISSSVTYGPKVTQKERKAAKKTLNKKTIAHLSRLVKSGKLNLPDLDLESNEEFEAIWALVDSGAARSCAKRDNHFGRTVTHLQPSSVKMATASGEELKSRGCFRLDALSVEGNQISQTFEDADVDMPIMAVTELSSNGKLGSQVVFNERDGHVMDQQTQATSKFYKRRGVYFMKLYILKDKSSDMDFHRPGAA